MAGSYLLIRTNISDRARQRVPAFLGPECLSVWKHRRVICVQVIHSCQRQRAAKVEKLNTFAAQCAWGDVCMREMYNMFMRCICEYKDLRR